MSLIIDMLASRGKGADSPYRPHAGEICKISGPNCDSEDGYIFGVFEVLWRDDTFVLYRSKGCWPVLNKWDHVICRPIKEQEEAKG